MLPSATELRLHAAALARRSGTLLAGGVLATLGAGFLVSAVWLVLAQAFGALVASLSLAALLIGAGLLVIRAAPPPPVLPDPAERLRRMGARGKAWRPTGQLPPLAEAFLFGLSVALQIRGGKR